MGRKPLPISLKRDHRIAVMLTEGELKTAEKLRETLGQPTLSDTMREAMHAMAAEVLKPKAGKR